MNVRACGHLVVIAALATTGHAYADVPDNAAGGESVATPEGALAERYFNEGRELAARGDYVAACAAFAASGKIRPTAMGPLLNLALCKESLRQFAAARELFREVIARSSNRPDRVAFAEEHLRAIAAKTSMLRIAVVSPVPGLVVTVDGQPLLESAWGQDIPTDGGAHIVTATAPDKRTLEVNVDLAPEGARGLVTIALEDAPRNGSAGYWVGGAGAAVLAVGIGFGIAVTVECGGFFTRVCKGANDHPTAAEREQELRAVDTRAWVSTIATGVGLAGVAGGALLLFSAKRHDRARVTATVTPTGGAIRGTF